MTVGKEKSEEQRSGREQKYAANLREALKPAQSVTAKARSVLRSAIINLAALLPKRKESFTLRCIFLHTVMQGETLAFEELLKLVAARGDVIGTREVLDIITGNAPLDGCYFHISFDDGFADVVRYAVPILIDHRMTATIFVATALVDADFDNVAHYCVQTLGYAAPIEVANWEELRQAHNAGFEIGSHTHNHTRLSSISGDMNLMMNELANSKSIIEKNLGSSCISIAWPYGGRFDVDGRAIAAVRLAGYKACFSGIRGRVRPGITDPFRIPRHHIEAHWPNAHKKACISGFGEGKID
jgi:hypothetical protein